MGHRRSNFLFSGRRARQDNVTPAFCRHLAISLNQGETQHDPFTRIAKEAIRRLA
jgi:hypothetical protein